MLLASTSLLGFRFLILAHAIYCDLLVFAEKQISFWSFLFRWKQFRLNSRNDCLNEYQTTGNMQPHLLDHKGFLAAAIIYSISFLFCFVFKLLLSIWICGFGSSVRKEGELKIVRQVGILIFQGVKEQRIRFSFFDYIGESHQIFWSLLLVLRVQVVSCLLHLSFSSKIHSLRSE